MSPGWPGYLEAVDEPSAAKDVRVAAEAYMAKHNLMDPRQAAGLEVKDIQAMKGWEKLPPPVQALLGRTMCGMYLYVH